MTLACENCGHQQKIVRDSHSVFGAVLQGWCRMDGRLVCPECARKIELRPEGFEETIIALLRGAIKPCKTKEKHFLSNKKLGNRFEQELAEKLYEEGFWVHLFTQNKDGQPADLIAVRNRKAYLIDCKVCSDEKGFALSRMEENQRYSMSLWKECGNGEGWFALKTSKGVFMVNRIPLECWLKTKSKMTMRDIMDYGRELDVWLKIC